MHINLPTCIWTNLVSYFWPRNSFQSQSDTNPMPGNLAALTMATMLQCPQMFKFPVPAQLVISKMFLNHTVSDFLSPTDKTAIQDCDCDTTTIWNYVIFGLVTCVSSVISGLVLFFLTRAYLKLRKRCTKTRNFGVQVEMNTLYSTGSTSALSFDSYCSAKSRLS